MTTTQTTQRQSATVPGGTDREARPLDRDALPGRRGGLGRGRGGSRCVSATGRDGAVGGGLGGDRFRIRTGAPAGRQELQGARELRPAGRGPLAGQDGLRSGLPTRAARGDSQAEERSGSGDRGGSAGRRVDRARSSHRRDPRRRSRQRERDGARSRRAEGPAREAQLGRGPGQPRRQRRLVVRLQPGEQVGDAEVRADLVAGHARDPRARVRLAGRCRASAHADDRGNGRCGGVAVDRYADRRHLDLVDELRPDVRAGAGDRLRPPHRLPLPRRLLRLEAAGRRGGRRNDGHRRQGRAVLRRDSARSR